MTELFLMCLFVSVGLLFLFARLLGRFCKYDEGNVADKEIKANRSGIIPKGFL
jgi:hypothetical protein